MKKIWLLLMVLILSFQLYPSGRASANSTLVKIAIGSAGEAIMIGVAEKAGVYYANTQSREKALARINYQAYNITDTALATSITAWEQEIKNAKIDPLVGRPGYSKVILSATAFLTGADLIYDMYHSFNNGYVGQKVVNLLAEDVEAGSVYTQYQNVIMRGGNEGAFSNGTKWTQWRLSAYTTSWENIVSATKASANGKELNWFKVLSNDGTATTFEAKFSGIGENNLAWTETQQGWILNSKITNPNKPIIESYIPDSVPSYNRPSIIPQTVADEGLTVQEKPTDFPDTVEIIIKDDWSDNEKVNEPLQPVPVDSDGDGMTDDVDPYPNDPDNVEPEPEDKPLGSSWWDWLLKPLFALVDGISKLLTSLIGLVTGLATAIAEAIGAIFVPSDGFFDGYFSDIKGSWDSKIPITGQLSDFMTTVKSSSGDASRPVIEIDLPPRYGGVKISVIDFSYFDQYRDWILNFIRFTAWFVFLKKLFARLPRIIGG